jgi:tetratricopeptide (TPR) repeat protein
LGERRVGPWSWSAALAIAPVLCAGLFTSAAQTSLSSSASAASPCISPADATAGDPEARKALLLQEGLRQLQHGNAACAQRQFQGAVDSDATSSPAWAGLGESEQALGQPLAAEESFRRAYALDPANLSAITHLAALLEQERQTTAAIGFWRIAQRLQPTDAGICFSLAAALLADGANQEAARLFRELLARKIGDRGTALVDLGTALARLGQYDEAAKVFEQSLAFPDVSDTARLSLVKALCTLLHYQEALPYAQQYLASHPQDYEALYFMGLIDSGLGNSQAAERELRGAVAADPKQFDAQLQLGEALRHNGKASAAIASLHAATQLQPASKDAHFQLARAYSATGQTALAQQQYAVLKQQEQANAVQTQVTVLDNQAAAALQRHDTDGAAALYAQIEKLDPGNAKVLYDLAMLDLGNGKPAQGRALLKQAQALAPTMPEVNAELGYLDIVAGNGTQAEAELEAALKADPQSSQPLGNLGVLYAKQGKSAAAIRSLQLAVEVDPAYAQGYLNLGLVLAGEGRYVEAASALQQASSLAPGDAAAAKALSMVRQRMRSGATPTPK